LQNEEDELQYKLIENKLDKKLQELKNENNSNFDIKIYDNQSNLDSKFNDIIHIDSKISQSNNSDSNNINTNNINNLKSNVEQNTNTNYTNNYNNEKLYTISNNSNNRNFFINTINYEDNANINKKANKYKNNLYGLSKNLRFVCSEKNLNLFKNERILSTEPKEIIKKQFSFNKAIKKQNKDNIHINEEMNKYLLNSKKRSKTEKIIKCQTINTEGGRSRFKTNNNQKLTKKYSYKKGVNLKKKFNNIEDMLLYMFIEQKHNIKNNNK
jgi:hypothetical protein